MALQAKLVGLTIVLTGLIWFYADQANSKSEHIVVALEPIVAQGSDEAVSLVRPDNGRLQVTVRGPNRAIQRLLSEVPTRLKQLSWPVPIDLGAGAHRLDAVEQLSRIAYFRDRGLSVTAVEPPKIEIVGDSYVWRQVPVIPQVLEHDVVGSPQVEPETVRVRILASALHAIAEEELRIVLPLDQLLAGQPEDELLRPKIPVPVRMGQADISPEPDHVTVKLTLRGRSMTRKLERVVIKFLLDARTWQGYIPSPDHEVPLTQAITVRGPKETVEALEPEHVVGQIEITSRDLADPSIPCSRKPEFVLPPGVELVSEPVPVEFSLMPLK